MQDKLTSVLVATALLAIALSGCAGGEEEHEHEEGDEHDDHEGAGDGNETGDPGSGSVSAAISVKIDGNASTPQNGSFLAKVGDNITFDGSSSTGDNLSYAWDFGDNDTANNATAVHAFKAPGMFHVTLTVSSGDASDEEMVMFNITAAGPPKGSIVWTEKFGPKTGTLTYGNPNACSPSPANADCVNIPLPIADKDPNGTAVLAKKIVITLDGSGTTNIDMSLYFIGPTGTTIQSKTSAPPATSIDETITHEGDMPAGNYNIRVRLNAGAQGAYSVSATISYASV